MKAVILAGGLGTRLREETEFRPKPMVEIGGRPVLWHIMKHLGTYGIQDFVIAVGYKGEIIKDYFLNYETRNNDFTIRLGERESVTVYGGHAEAGWTVTLADTGPETHTGGRLLRAAKYFSDEQFLVAYGDGLSDVNIDALRRRHALQETIATVTVTQPPSRYGVVQLGEDRRVEAFQEKPRLDGWVNIGYFIMEPAALRYLAEDTPLEKEPLGRLAADGQLGAYQHDGFWQPMDTYREAVLLNEMWSQGTAPWIQRVHPSKGKSDSEA